MLSTYYVRSDADSGRVLDVFDVSGAGEFAGLLYTQELSGRGPLSHRISLGIDDRRFDHDLLYGDSGVDVAPPPVRSRPVTLGYVAEYAGDAWGLDLWLQYARSLASGSDSDDDVYDANRVGARSEWDAWRGGAALSWPLPGHWSARALFEGQSANEALIAGEQFALGGARSVRGFSEREIAGDDGVRGSLELWSPGLGRTGVRFVLFADAGRVTNEPSTDSLFINDTVSSLGAGIHWNWKDQVGVLLDVGVVVDGTPSREDGARGHLNVQLRY